MTALRKLGFGVDGQLLAVSGRITLPNDSRLKAALTAPRWKLQGRSIQVESRDDIVKRLGRSPDWASAYILALIDTPKIGVFAALTQRPEHDPRKPTRGLQPVRALEPLTVALPHRRQSWSMIAGAA